MGPSERETELAETVKSLREELAAYEGEVMAARRLQNEVANAHLLTEQLTSSQRRAERAEAAAGVTQRRSFEILNFKPLNPQEP
jgi:hypothetical protein